MEFTLATLTILLRVIVTEVGYVSICKYLIILSFITILLGSRADLWFLVLYLSVALMLFSDPYNISSTWMVLLCPSKGIRC